ncbi:peptidase A4 family-domain-containing protein [Mycena sanguinolenta]|nr:peptidase A4 family-domain-containing protein [Mycena sanguinolenta]
MGKKHMPEQSRMWDKRLESGMEELDNSHATLLDHQEHESVEHLRQRVDRTEMRMRAALAHISATLKEHGLMKDVNWEDDMAVAQAVIPVMVGWAGAAFESLAGTYKPVTAVALPSIVEDFDEGNSLVPFANFGTVTFTSAQATTQSNSVVGPSGAVIIDLEQNNKVLTSVSSSSSFVTVTYV